MQIRDEDAPTELDLKTYHLAMAKARLAKAQAHHDALERDVVKLLEAVGRKSMTVGGRKFTRRFTERLTFNEAGLRKAMGAVAYNKLTDRKLVRAKVDAAVASGQLDAVILSQNTEVKQTKSWIAITDVGEDDE